MPSCAIITCKHRSDLINLHTDGITFHRFPSDPEIKEKWIAATCRGPVWWPSKRSTICSIHFTEDQFRPLPKSRRLFEWAVPTLKLPQKPTSKEQDAQPGPSSNSPSRAPWQDDPDSSDSNVSKTEDPLRKGILEQCRFCGEFKKNCIDLSDEKRPYLHENKTTITLNDTRVELDFNSETLRKAVCRECDGKLKEMTDFVKQVKNAQESFINFGYDATEEETVTVKLEFESDDDTEDKATDDKATEDPLTETDAEFMNETAVFTHKRKINEKHTPTPKKKAKVNKENTDKDISNKKISKSKDEDKDTADKQRSEVIKVICEPELIMDIKEEVTEMDEDLHRSSETSDTVDRPSEVELATSALISEMANESR